MTLVRQAAELSKSTATLEKDVTGRLLTWPASLYQTHAGSLTDILLQLCFSATLIPPLVLDYLRASLDSGTRAGPALVAPRHLAHKTLDQFLKVAAVQPTPYVATLDSIFVIISSYTVEPQGSASDLQDLVAGLRVLPLLISSAPTAPTTLVYLQDLVERILANGHSEDLDISDEQREMLTSSVELVKSAGLGGLMVPLEQLWSMLAPPVVEQHVYPAIDLDENVADCDPDVAFLVDDLVSLSSCGSEAVATANMFYLDTDQ